MAIVYKYRVHIHMDHSWVSRGNVQGRLLFAIESPESAHAEAVAGVYKKAFPDATVKIEENRREITTNVWEAK